jgi:hypothetical protein
MSRLDFFGFRSCIRLSALVLYVVLANVAAWAQSEHHRAAVFIDVAAQPLAAALSKFGDQSGHEVLYDTSVAAGKSSRAVHGLLRPDEALAIMLAGTDLAAKYISGNAFVLLDAPVANPKAFVDLPASHRAYYGVIQRTLLGILCRSQETQPGRYRLVLLLWLRGDGGIERMQRLGSIGNDIVDQRADAAISAVRFAEPPPRDLAQPVLLVILPQASGITPGCSSELPLAERRLR